MNEYIRKALYTQIEAEVLWEKLSPRIQTLVDDLIRAGARTAEVEQEFLGLVLKTLDDLREGNLQRKEAV